MLKIYFRNLEGFRPDVKKAWIRNLIGWKPAVIANSYANQMFEESGTLDLKFNPWKDFNSNIIMLNYEDPSWNFERYMKFSALDFPLMMERGYLPLRVDYFDSVDSFFGGFGLRTKGMPINNSTATNSTKPTNSTNPIGSNVQPGPTPENPNVDPNEPLPPPPSVIPESSSEGPPPDPTSPDASGSDSAPFPNPTGSSDAPPVDAPPADPN